MVMCRTNLTSDHPRIPRLQIELNGSFRRTYNMCSDETCLRLQRIYAPRQPLYRLEKMTHVPVFLYSGARPPQYRDPARQKHLGAI